MMWQRLTRHIRIWKILTETQKFTDATYASYKFNNNATFIKRCFELTNEQGAKDDSSS
jgi:hypothetical protein